MAELNFNATLYHPMQPEDEVSDYEVWLELCKRLDQELLQARFEWRQAVHERDKVFSELKAKTDALRLRCAELEARPKPPSPKKV